MWHKVAFREHLRPVFAVSVALVLPNCGDQPAIKQSTDYMATDQDVNHPFANSKNLLVVVRDDKLDLEEEYAMYNSITEVRYKFASGFEI